MKNDNIKKGLPYFWHNHKFDNVKGVIHVGAHLCEECDFYHRKGVENVMFFEPLVGLYQKFWYGEHSIKSEDRWDNKFKIFEYHNVALGDHNSDKESFYSYHKTNQSSVFKKSNDRLKFDIIDVKMKKLSDYDISNYNMLVIDTQGSELNVLKGMSKNQLKSIDYIISEVYKEKIYENCSLITEIDNYLKEYNYYRIDQEWCGKTWGNALYKNKK